MKGKLSTLLYEAMEEMFSNDPHGEVEEQLQYEYWAGKLHAYADVLDMLMDEEKEEES